MSVSLELKYFVLHLYHALCNWLYKLWIHLAHKYLYCFFSAGGKALLDHEYKITKGTRRTLLTHLQDPFSLLSFYFFGPPTHPPNALKGLSYLRAARTDTPSAAFLRIVHMIHRLSTYDYVDVRLRHEVQSFWSRGKTDATKSDYFLFGGKWLMKDLPDPRKHLGNDPFLCAIAASTAEQMVEVFNWHIGLGNRRDLTRIRTRRPYWDKNLAPCVEECAPGWCKDVGPVPVQTIVDREGGDSEAVARHMLESKGIPLSPSFKKRNLLAGSEFLCFV